MTKNTATLTKTGGAYNPSTKTGYVIYNKTRRTGRHDGYRVGGMSHATRNDIILTGKKLYEYLQSNEYVTYEGRGIASKWVRVNAKRSTVVSLGTVIIDLAKLWTVRKLTNKHANTMRKAAHKIKVNAFKSIRRVGDKRLT